MTNDLCALKPHARKAAHEFIEDLMGRKIPHKVMSTLRTDIEQVALFLQGRASLEVVNLVRKYAGLHLIAEAENTYSVTNCDGMNTKSNHQLGIALDVVPLGEFGNPIWPVNKDPRWLLIGEIGEKHGFKWAGRWAKPDPAHHEFLS
jgi:hypothetical protein